MWFLKAIVWTLLAAITLLVPGGVLIALLVLGLLDWA